MKKRISFHRKIVLLIGNLIFQLKRVNSKMKKMMKMTHLILIIFIQILIQKEIHFRTIIQEDLIKSIQLG